MVERDIQMRIEPFGELVDILEESLKHSTIIQEILELTPYVFDEELVLKKIYELFSELFQFDSCYFAISSLSTLRVYGFGKEQLAFPEDLKEVIAKISDVTSYINFEENFVGTRRLKCEYVIEQCISRKTWLVSSLSRGPQHLNLSNGPCCL